MPPQVVARRRLETPRPWAKLVATVASARHQPSSSAVRHAKAQRASAAPPPASNGWLELSDRVEAPVGWQTVVCDWVLFQPKVKLAPVTVVIVAAGLTVRPPSVKRGV